MKYRVLLYTLIFAALGIPAAIHTSIAASQAMFTEISGTVEVRSQNSSVWTPAVQGRSIAPGTVISAAFRSTAVISIGSTKILVRPVTKLTLEELVQNAKSDDVTLFMQTGRIRAEVQPPSGGKTNFTVRSPTVTASVRGTSFDFDTVNLRVDSGLVHYTNTKGQAVYVARGESAYMDEKDGRIVSPQEIAATGLPALPQDTGINAGSTAPHVPPPAELRVQPVWK